MITRVNIKDVKIVQNNTTAIVWSPNCNKCFVMANRDGLPFCDLCDSDAQGSEWLCTAMGLPAKFSHYTMPEDGEITLALPDRDEGMYVFEHISGYGASLDYGAVKVVGASVKNTAKKTYSYDQFEEYM